jgi:hypothetical protein
MGRGGLCDRSGFFQHLQLKKDNMRLRWLIAALLMFLTAMAQAQPQGPDTLWTRSYYLQGIQIQSDLLPTNDGGYLAAGISDPSGNYHEHGILVRLNAVGDTLWTRTYGDSTHRSWFWRMKPVPEGGFVVVGSRIGDVSSQSEACLVRLTDDGQTIWEKSYPDTNLTEAIDVCVTLDGGFILCGYYHNPNLHEQTYLIKTNALGDILWTRFYPQPISTMITTHGFGIAQRVDGGYIITSDFRGYYPEITGTYVTYTNSSGDTLWTRIISEHHERLGEVFPQANGHFMLSGGGWVTGSQTRQFCMIEMDETGSIQNSHITTGWDDWGVIRTADSGFVAAFTVYMPETHSYSASLVRMNDHADTLWTRSYYNYPTSGIAMSLGQATDRGYLLNIQLYGISNPNSIWIRTLPDPAQSITPPFQSVLAFELTQNYPNPFNATTTISYALSKPVYVDLNIYDVTGRLVRRLAGGHTGPPLQAGEHSVVFDGSELASGINFVRMDAAGISQTRKMVLLK